MSSRDIDRLLLGYMDGRLTRRAFLRRGAVMGLSAGSLATLLEACAQTTTPASPSASTGGAISSSAPSGGPSAAATGEPKKGGTLVHSSSVVPNGGFDHNKHWDWIAVSTGFSCFDPLLKLDPATSPVKIVPWLSTMPEVNQANTSFVFHLNPAAKFQTGDPVTAADAKFTLERLVNPDFGAEMGTLYNPIPYVGGDDFKNGKTPDIAGIKVVDDHTLQIDLERPESTFLYVLAYPSAGIVNSKVVKQMGDKEYDLHPTGGSGPFKMTEANLDSGLVFERNENYWNAPFPYVDQVKWSWPVDPQLAILRIQNGEQDTMLENVPTGAIAGLKADTNNPDGLVIGEFNEIQSISLNLTHEAMSKLEVRQAMAMAIDRDRISQVLQGIGRSASTGGVLTPGLGALYTPDIGYKYDPAAAKQLLAKAGYENGFDLVYHGGNISPFKEQNQVIQQNLTDIGIRVDLQLQDFTSLVNQWIAHPQAIIDYQCEIAYPNGAYLMDQAFSQAAIDNKCCNPSGFSDPHMEELLKRGHEAATDADQVAVYKEADKYVTKDQVTMIPTIYQNKPDYVSKRVRPSFFTAQSPSADFKHFYEFWLES
jgi:peptide/nickel transport system substrate-binding protein